MESTALGKLLLSGQFISTETEMLNLIRDANEKK